MFSVSMLVLELGKIDVGTVEGVVSMEILSALLCVREVWELNACLNCNGAVTDCDNGTGAGEDEDGSWVEDRKSDGILPVISVDACCNCR